jgi:hypothetical protein
MSRALGLMPSLAALGAALVCFSVLAPHAAASDHLDDDEPESWAMFYFTSVTLFSGLGTPHTRKPWSVELAFEVGSIPHLNEEQRTVGFGGTKTDDLNKAPLFARPIVTVGLPWKLALSLSYLPPVEVFDVRAHLFALAVERPLYERGPWTFGLRTYGQLGYAKSAFTCPRHLSNFPPGSAGNPYGCNEESEDKALQHYLGFEASGSYRVAALRGLTPYLTLGANLLDTKFRVHAETFGEPDRTRLSSDTWTVSTGAGIRYPLSEKVRFSVGAFYTPLWVTRPPDTSDELDGLFNVRTALAVDLF